MYIIIVMRQNYTTIEKFAQCVFDPNIGSSSSKNANNFISFNNMIIIIVIITGVISKVCITYTL